MTLSELATYYQQSAEGTGSWNNIGHDWMVNNIDALAFAIRAFVQKNYLTTYATGGGDLEPYRALAFKGLMGSKFYSDKVTNAGKAAQYLLYLGSLSEGGKCND